MGKYCFVSCTNKDNTYAKVIKNILMLYYDVVTCKSLGVGYEYNEKYMDLVPESIKSADFYIAVISPEAIKSDQFVRELSYAYSTKKNIMLVFTKVFSIHGPMNLMLADIEARCFFPDVDFKASFMNCVHMVTGNNIYDIT